MGAEGEMADIVLINPRFNVSYWGLEHALPFLHVKAILPTASLPLLAALTPAGHHVQLIDENVEEIDFDRCARADLVGVTGMNVQRQRMREIMRERSAASSQLSAAPGLRCRRTISATSPRSSLWGRPTRRGRVSSGNGGRHNGHNQHMGAGDVILIG